MTKPKQIEASDANAGARAEAEGTDITFDFDGEEWTIGSGDNWPRTAGLAFSEIADSAANPARALKYVDQFIEGVLGPVQFRRFTAKPGRKTADVNDMYRAIFQAYGFSSGE